MDVYSKMEEIGLKLPKVPKPVASYVVAKQSGKTVYSSGQTAVINGILQYEGKLGKEISISAGQKSARLAVLNCLASIEYVVEDLNLIAEITRLTGYVASAQGFGRQPAVVEGASRLLLDIFGERGQHARSAIGVAELPFGASVEIELIVQLG